MKRPIVFFNTQKLFVLLAALLLVPGLASADPIAVRGAALANACAACHGPDGRSQGAIPSLDGLSAEYFKKTMQAFRNDGLQGTIMNHIAKGLGDADIEAVTAHFASLKGGKPE